MRARDVGMGVSSITYRHLSRDLYVLLECLACHCMST